MINFFFMAISHCPHILIFIYNVRARYLYVTDTLTTPTITEPPSVECQDLFIPCQIECKCSQNRPWFNVPSERLNNEVYTFLANVDCAMTFRNRVFLLTEILLRLAYQEYPPYRPRIPKPGLTDVMRTTNDEEVIDLMVMAWDESPLIRQPFYSIYYNLKRIRSAYGM